MGERLDQAIAEAADIEAAEAARGHDDDAPLPPHVKVSRPNRARSRVLQVRLNPDEMEALEQFARRCGLPVSTVAREQLLHLVTPQKGEPGQRIEAVRALIDQLSSTVSQLRYAHSAVVLGDEQAHDAKR